jgi:hypothetical protein
VAAVDHDDCVIGARGEAVDADLAYGAAQGLNQVGAQVGAERPGQLRAVAEEAKGQLKGVFVSDPDWQASVAAGRWSRTTWWSWPAWAMRRTSLIRMSRESRSVAVGMASSSFAPRRERPGASLDATGPTVGERNR